jgi:UDP-2-acetamido-3-amino-2,3-dideoxy-glucuronate N-acetyltransferase
MPGFDPTKYPGVSIHESCYIDEPCSIGKGTKIWHFSHIMPHCSIGERCNLGQNVVVSPHVRLGNNVKVQNNVSIYTGVQLEDDVFCGPSMVFTNILIPRSEIVRRDEYVKTYVRRGASLGANCTIICGIDVGQYALIGSGAVVSKDVPAYGLMVGVPARRISWVCRCGQTLPKATTSATGALLCAACGNEYLQYEHGLKPIFESQSHPSAALV